MSEPLSEELVAKIRAEIAADPALAEYARETAERLRKENPGPTPDEWFPNVEPGLRKFCAQVEDQLNRDNPPEPARGGGNLGAIPDSMVKFAAEVEAKLTKPGV